MSDCCQNDCCSSAEKTHTYDGCKVREVNSGTAVRVSDRNGNEKQLVKKPNSIVYTNSDGEVKNADGKNEDIILPLQAGAGSSIVTLEDVGEGLYRLKRLTPDDLSKEYFSMYINGEMALIEHPTLRTKFKDSEIEGAKSGYIALLTCSEDGKIQLVKFTGCGGEDAKPLVVDPDGKVKCQEVATCDDAVESEEFSAIRACYPDGDSSTEGLIKPPTALDAAEIAYCNGKYKHIERGLGFYPVDPSVVWTTSDAVQENTAVTLSTAPDPICEDGDVYAVLMCNCSSYRKNTYPSIRMFLYINDNLVAATGEVIYQGTPGDSMFIAKLTDKKFNVKFSTSGTPATNYLAASVKVIGYYK